MMSDEVEGGKPARDASSPAANATSRWASAKHLQALIAKVFGHGHRRPRTPPAYKGRLVRCCGHDDGPGHAFGAQHPFGKFTQFAPAFTHQRDDHHIRRHPPREPREQRGLPHTRACEKPNPLAPHQGQQRVKHGHTR
jgi:hypothetical protein